MYHCSVTVPCVHPRAQGWHAFVISYFVYFLFGLSLGVVWFFMVRTGLPSETAGTAKKTPPTIQRLDLPAPMSVDFEMEDMHAAEPDDSIV
eukprot:m.102045 g.102045  ORF g.102045 m.102045 type:complete len:91 (-) comp16817_c0_seq26:96-368(-)